MFGYLPRLTLKVRSWGVRFERTDDRGHRDDCGRRRSWPYALGIALRQILDVRADSVGAWVHERVSRPLQLTSP